MVNLAKAKLNFSPSTAPTVVITVFPQPATVKAFFLVLFQI